ncbi:hypothetical protein GCM10009864_36610 [Streptomyces lunalinharesii]|uniref:Uncharacterized protein n=1 Tax=Streptomyces lunalinharesii TaxID=333384 RepID=A0ABP6EBN6_9ACTN
MTNAIARPLAPAWGLTFPARRPRQVLWPSANVPDTVKSPQSHAGEASVR